ncbi:MAG: class I SAM-dependent methyltransferase [Xanthobacteraceae bacterium]|nr:MAG: class I SAM-dependent methyltransferase [Xanthobacteraceae bacterium]
MSLPLRSPLEQEIRRLIAVAGPLPVARYMELCLAHPEHGYYRTRDPLGRAGDFTTAPEISQMFGELIGLWAASVWQQMGAPRTVRLVELGPGRGTMMMDALRAIRIVPDFYQAVDVHLVDINPALRAAQEATLAPVKVPVSWHDSLDSVPDGPLIVLANEFFDALPIHQAVRLGSGWYERVVAIDDKDQFAYGTARLPLPRFDLLVPRLAQAAPTGSIFEWRPDGAMMALARRVRTEGGAALIIDYGHARGNVGDTFQAIVHHAFADPLQTPGEADLTAHVDFEALARAAGDVGARVHGPVEQGRFLQRMGIESRAASLMAKASRETADDIASALQRLTGSGRGGMGSLFKVLGVSDPSLRQLPGISDFGGEEPAA